MHNLKWLKFLAIAIFLFQNCGEFQPAALNSSQLDTSGSPFAQEEPLKFKSVEIKRWHSNGDAFFQNLRVDITKSTGTVILNESDICQANFTLGDEQRQSVYDLFAAVTYRNKSAQAATSSKNVSSIIIEDLNGQKIEAAIVLDNSDEAALPANQRILVESQQAIEKLDELLAINASDRQQACTVTQEVPEFVEYIWTDVVNDQAIAQEAFLVEAQSGGSTVFLSSIDADSCFLAHRLVLHEQAILLKILTQITLSDHTQDPENSVGVRYVDYHYSDRSPRYYIDPVMAPNPSQLINNGESYTDMVLALLERVKDRYAAESREPTPISRCVIN